MLFIQKGGTIQHKMCLMDYLTLRRCFLVILVSFVKPCWILEGCVVRPEDSKLELKYPVLLRSAPVLQRTPDLQVFAEEVVLGAFVHAKTSRFPVAELLGVGVSFHSDLRFGPGKCMVVYFCSKNIKQKNSRERGFFTGIEEYRCATTVWEGDDTGRDDLTCKKGFFACLFSHIFA